MKIIDVQQQTVQGISVRTKNSDEMNPKTGKIGGLWGNFSKSFGPHMSNDDQVYGVYCAYESDHNGEFNVLAGMKNVSDEAQKSLAEPLETVTLEAGRYAVFSGTGAMPQEVVEVWQEIWQHFNAPDCPHKRQYKTDFEHYTSRESVDIYIGIA